MSDITPEIRAQLSKPIVLSPPNADAVHVRRGVLYKQVDGLDLLLDIYEPGQSNGEKHPAVLFLHGGVTMTWLEAFSPRDWGQYQGWGKLVASAGFVGIVTTRRSEFNEAWKFTHGQRSLDDIDDVFTYLHSHAEELRIDLDRLVIWSCSAGVPSGVIAGIRHQVRCIVAYYGIMELAVVEAWMPDGDTRALVEKYSPLSVLNQTDTLPPTLIVRVGKDSSELNMSIMNFVTQAIERNQPLELISYPEGQHGFDVFDDTDRSRQIIRRTVEFMHEWT